VEGDSGVVGRDVERPWAAMVGEGEGEKRMH
jgi:hypothetical protein